jgi:hypothetical protein
LFILSIATGMTPLAFVIPADCKAVSIILSKQNRGAVGQESQNNPLPRDPLLMVA